MNKKITMRRRRRRRRRISIRRIRRRNDIQKTKNGDATTITEINVAETKNKVSLSYSMFTATESEARQLHQVPTAIDDCTNARP